VEHLDIDGGTGNVEAVVGGFDQGVVVAVAVMEQIIGCCGLLE
jgi:hypothetical protein